MGSGRLKYEKSMSNKHLTEDGAEDRQLWQSGISSGRTVINCMPTVENPQ